MNRFSSTKNFVTFATLVHVVVKKTVEIPLRPWRFKIFYTEERSSGVFPSPVIPRFIRGIQKKVKLNPEDRKEFFSRTSPPHPTPAKGL